MTENVWEWLISMEGRGSLHDDLHYTTCMRMYENASDYLIMDQHACDEHASEFMRMYENGSYSGRGVWGILGWFAGCDMPENEWECMRMTETVWECLISMEGGMSFHADLHYTTCMRMNWDCIRLCHNRWACMRWECMRMTENDWECQIFRGRVGHLRLSCIIRHAW